MLHARGHRRCATTSTTPGVGQVLGLQDFKIDLPAVAALLTLVGYSVNDIIVVFDRIREVRGKNPLLTPQMINDSVNQTLSRTILTSTTVFLVSVSRVSSRCTSSRTRLARWCQTEPRVTVAKTFQNEVLRGGQMGIDVATKVLVTTEWLAEHLTDPAIVVAEVDENPDVYEEGHIPGAVKLHWRDDLQDKVIRDVVSKGEFERLLGERGISSDTPIVLYGDKNNWFAAYAFWYLKIYGHEDVRLLDGGRQKSIEENRELTTDPPTPTPATYVAKDRDETIRIRSATRSSPASTTRRSRLSTSGARRSSPASSWRHRATSRRVQREPVISLAQSRFRGRRPCGRRHVQEHGRARGALQREGDHLRQGSPRVLPHRRALGTHLVRVD